MSVAVGAVHVTVALVVPATTFWTISDVGQPITVGAIVSVNVREKDIRN